MERESHKHAVIIFLKATVAVKSQCDEDFTLNMLFFNCCIQGQSVSQSVSGIISTAKLKLPSRKILLRKLPQDRGKGGKGQGQRPINFRVVVHVSF